MYIYLYIFISCVFITCPYLLECLSVLFLGIFPVPRTIAKI